MKLFYIGERFYSESSTWMSPIYHEGTFQRSDWGKVSIALQHGESVSIRPATDEEMDWAKAKLKETKKEVKRVYGME